MRGRAEELAAGRDVAQIVSLVRDDIAHSSTGVGQVPGVAGDDVDVEVGDGLSSGGVNIDADVESIRLMPAKDLLTDSLDPFEQSGLLVPGGVEPGGDVTARNNQRVTG